MKQTRNDIPNVKIVTKKLSQTVHAMTWHLQFLLLNKNIQPNDHSRVGVSFFTMTQHRNEVWAVWNITKQRKYNGISLVSIQLFFKVSLLDICTNINTMVKINEILSVLTIRVFFKEGRCMLRVNICVTIVVIHIDDIARSNIVTVYLCKKDNSTQPFCYVLRLFLFLITDAWEEAQFTDWVWCMEFLSYGLM